MDASILKYLEEQCKKDDKRQWNSEWIPRKAFETASLPRYWECVDYYVLRLPSDRFFLLKSIWDDFDCVHWSLSMKLLCLNNNIYPEMYQKAGEPLPPPADLRYAISHGDKYSAIGKWLWLMLGCIDLLKKELVFIIYELGKNTNMVLPCKSDIAKWGEKRLRSYLNTQVDKVFQHWCKEKSKYALWDAILKKLNSHWSWVQELITYRNLFTHNALHFIYGNRLIKIDKPFMNNAEYQQIRAHIEQLNGDGQIERMHDRYLQELEIGDYMRDRREKFLVLCEEIYALILLQLAKRFSITGS